MDLYIRRNPLGPAVPVVASLPHSGLYVPAQIGRSFEPEHRQWLRNTDWFLPELYRFLPELGVTMLVATHSRYVVDLNRDPLAELHGSFSRSLIAADRRTATAPRSRKNCGGPGQPPTRVGSGDSGVRICRLACYRSESMTDQGIRGILMDLDETIHSREAAFWMWLESEATRSGVVLERERIAVLDARGRGDKARLLEHLSQVFEWRETHEQHMERFRTGLAAHVKLEPGVRDVLVRVRREYRLGLISNGTGATQRAKLSSLAIEELFDPIVISGEVGFRKPDGRIFELAIASWGLPRESVLFVGDDPVSDIQGAREAGMPALQVGDGGIPSILSLEAWLKERRS